MIFNLTRMTGRRPLCDFQHGGISSRSSLSIHGGHSERTSFSRKRMSKYGPLLRVERWRREYIWCCARSCDFSPSTNTNPIVSLQPPSNLAYWISPSHALSDSSSTMYQQMTQPLASSGKSSLIILLNGPKRDGVVMSPQLMHNISTPCYQSRQRMFKSRWPSFAPLQKA